MEASIKKERSLDGSEDENVFDIQQGVAIGIFIKDPRKSGLGTVHHADLWGNREEKYEWLGFNSIEKDTVSVESHDHSIFILKNSV